MAMNEEQAFNILTHHFQSGRATRQDFEKAIGHKSEFVKYLGIKHTHHDDHIDSAINNNEPDILYNDHLKDHHITNILNKVDLDNYNSPFYPKEKGSSGVVGRIYKNVANKTSISSENIHRIIDTGLRQPIEELVSKNKGKLSKSHFDSIRKNYTGNDASVYNALSENSTSKLKESITSYKSFKNFLTEQ